MYIDVNVEETELDKEVDVGLKKLKIDNDSEVTGAFTTFTEKEFGLCHDCKNLLAYKTEYGTIKGKCYEFEIWLKSSDVIKHCTRYDKKGQMSILEMKQLAYIIDVNYNKMGFL